MTAMKIERDHYRIIHNGIKKVMSVYPGFTLEHYLKCGLTAKRFRWDCLWKAEKVGHIPNRYIVDVIYPYANDD